MVKWQECQMQRYFVLPEQISEQEVLIRGEDVHHLKNVMRAKPGQQLIVCSGQGLDYQAEVMEIGAQEVRCRILGTSASRGEPDTKVTIAQSVPKGDKLEWIIQKGTELGAVSIIPFISKRTVVKIDARKAEKKRERWQRIAKEAAEQAHRGRIPAVSNPLSWEKLLEQMERAEAAFIAYEKGGIPLKQAILSTKAKNIMLIIGPEGGFEEGEIAEAKGKGVIPITLGSRILRTETAPLVALSCIMFARDDLGGENL
jgi:16S rRNA (uracil1498-N3)-methyltransferase